MKIGSTYFNQEDPFEVVKIVGMDINTRKQKILYEAKTKFNKIKVTRKGSIVTLWSPPSVMQSAVDTRNPMLPYLEYTRNVLLSLAFQPKPRLILVLGLGGGTIPTMLHHLTKRAHIEIIEIDAEMASVAKKYFDFSTTYRIQLIIDDAYHYIQNAVKTYDIIIMDAYIGGRLSKSLTSPDFFVETKKRLSPKGIFVANLLDSNNSHFKKLVPTIFSVFNELWLLPGELLWNTTVFAGNEKCLKLEMLRRARTLQGEIKMDIQFSKLAKGLRRYDRHSLT